MRTLLGKRGETLQELMNFCVVVPVFLAMGYSLSFGGGITGYKTVYTMFPTINTTTTAGAVKSHNSLIQGAAVSCLNLGAALGCLSTMYLGNRLGRRMTVMLGAVVTIIGTVLMCSAFSLGQFIVGRIVLGSGLGMMSSTVPVWQSEISKVHKRGHHVIIDGICIAAGIALSGWLTFGFSKAETTSSWNWRLPGMTTGILAIVVLVFTLSFPESPRWLALKGRYDEAKEVISIVDDVSVDSEHAQFVLASITSVNEAYAETAPLSSLFKYGSEKMVYRLLLAAMTQLFSQCSGSALITYYSSQLFTEIGLSKDLAKVLGSTDLTFKFICCAIPFFTIERAGRRKLLMIAASGMSTCMFAIAICGSQTTETNLVPAYVAIVFAFIFVAFYPIGFLGVNFLYSQEVITTRYRAPASGISTAVHWTSAFLVAFTTPIGFTSLGWKFYLIWGSVALSIIPSVYFFYPETTGLSMEQVDQVFIDSPSVFATVGLAEQRRKEAALQRDTLVGEVEQFNSAKKAEEQHEQALVENRV